MLYNFFKFIIYIFSRIFFRMKIYGVKNIPKKGGFIVASNHASYLDPLILGAASPRMLTFMARHDLFLNPFFGRLIRWVNAFPVKRATPDLSALKEAMRRVKKGKGLLVFPEGRRMEQGELGEASAGIGFLAAKLSVPVIPAFVKGTEKVLPKHAKFIRLQQISVHFGNQISIERRLPYQDIAENIMDKIRQLSCSG